MIHIKRTNTYLNQFDIQTKLTYDVIGKHKSIYWAVIFLISIAVQYIPVVLLSIAVGIAIGIFMVITGSSSWMERFSFLFAPPMSDWLNLVLGTGIVILFFFIYIRLIERRPFSSIGLKQQHKLQKYFKGALIAIVMQLSYFAIVLLFGWGEVVKEPIYATSGLGSSAIVYVLLFLVGFMIQGASEEVVVRGWMMPVLSRQYKISTAIVISSVFFGLLHMFNPNISLLSIVNLVLYGVFAALYAIYDGGLWGIFAQHSIWNWFMGNVLGLPVSGMIIGNVSIIKTKLTGPSLITGGSFGPEGGIIVTAIELIGIVVVLRKLASKVKS